MNITSMHTPETDDIRSVFEGRRIVEAEMNIAWDSIPEDVREHLGYTTDPKGRLVLDNGMVVYLAGNDGGCACSAGCYDLEKVATVDDIITDVRVHADPAGDDESGEGVYRIYVVADATEINVAEFSGSDGNGYYGTGFHVVITPMVIDGSLASKELEGALPACSTTTVPCGFTSCKIHYGVKEIEA